MYILTLMGLNCVFALIAGTLLKGAMAAYDAWKGCEDDAGNESK